MCTKKDIKSARFRVDQVNVKAEAPSKTVPPVKPARESHEDKHQLGNGKNITSLFFYVDLFNFF